MKHILPFLALLLLSSSLFAQNYFDHNYSFGDIDHPLAIVTDSVENIYVCGWFEDTINQVPHAFVLKTDADGQELWRVTLSDTSKFYALCLTHTGSLVMAGSKKNHCYLTSFDSSSGNEQWINEDTISGNFWLATVDEILDSTGYELFVRKETNGAHKIRYLLFNPLNGNLLLEHIDINTVNGVAYTSGLMAPDKVWTGGNYNEYIGLVWNKNFGTGLSGFLWTFRALHIAGVEKYSSERGSVVRYFRWSDGTYNMAVLTAKFDEEPDIWGNGFEIAHDTFNVAGSGKYENGRFVVTGTINQKLSLWFIDHDLTYMKEKTIDTDKARAGVDVVCLPSLDMILMGTEHPDSNDSITDVFLMKLDSTGVVSTPEHKLVENFTVYPNPATSRLYIKSAGYNLNYAKAFIVNSMGQTVKTITNLNRPVSVSDLSDGLYVIVVYNNGKLLYREKFIKK